MKAKELKKAKGALSCASPIPRIKSESNAPIPLFFEDICSYE